MNQKNTKKVNKGGRPTKYNAQKPQEVFDYIQWCEPNDELPTIEGLGWYLKVDSDTIGNWGKKHPKFLGAIKKLKEKQASMLQSGITRGKYNATGGIFLLKNNHGFKDKHDVDVTSDGERIEGIQYIVPEGVEPIAKK